MTGVQTCVFRSFITCSRVPQPLDSLLSMSMREGESVKAYAERYWEMFNEIDGDFDEVAIRTFKVGLSPEHGLRKSSFIPLLDLGRHEMNLTALDWDLR